MIGTASGRQANRPYLIVATTTIRAFSDVEMRAAGDPATGEFTVSPL